jgi:hypothetical protein
LARLKLARDKLLAAAGRPPEPGPVARQGQVGDFVRLIDRFAHELGVAGWLDELTSRAVRFQQLTAEGSGFDQARAAVSGALPALGGQLLGVEDAGTRPAARGGRARRIIPLNVGELRRFKDRQSRGPDAGPRIRAALASREALVWDLPQALADAARLRRATALPASAREAAGAWWAVLEGVVTISGRERLHGCHLVALCRDADGASGITQRMSGDFTRYAAAIRDAAEFLFAVAEGRDRGTHAPELVGSSEPRASRPSPVEAPEPGGVPPATEVPDWAHGAGEQRPEDFGRGPLYGNNKILAKAICPEYGYEGDTRGLHRLGRDGEVWIVRVRKQSLQVYFKDQKKLAECNARLLQLKNDKPPRKKRKAKQKSAK